MMNELTKKEQLSALMDGEVMDGQWDGAWVAASDDEGLMTWHAYHVVGDVLRSRELASATSTQVLLGALRERLAQEATERPVHADNVAAVQGELGDAANAAVFRWKLAAGFASLAAVAAVGWGVLSTAPVSPVGSQLASAPSAVVQPVNNGLVAVAGAENSSQVMIRDPRLDELLAAHRQFGATNTLQMPAGYLRNATFDSPGR